MMTFNPVCPDKGGHAGWPADHPIINQPAAGLPASTQKRIWGIANQTTLLQRQVQNSLAICAICDKGFF